MEYHLSLTFKHICGANDTKKCDAYSPHPKIVPHSVFVRGIPRALERSVKSVQEKVAEILFRELPSEHLKKSQAFMGKKFPFFQFSFT